MARTVRMTRGQLRGIIREEVSSLVEAAPAFKSKHDWDYYVEMTAYAVQAANEREEEFSAFEIADEVFHPSDDAAVRAMFDASSDPAEEELIEAAILKHAAAMDLDQDELRDAFYEGLDASEEYMSDEEDDDLDDDDDFDEDEEADAAAAGPMTVDEFRAEFSEAWESMPPDVKAAVEADDGVGIMRTAVGEVNVDVWSPALKGSWNYNDMDYWTKI